jgi:hypothetical protein
MQQNPAEPEDAASIAHNHRAGVRDDQPFLEKQFGSLVETFQKRATPLLQTGKTRSLPRLNNLQERPGPKNKTYLKRDTEQTDLSQSQERFWYGEQPCGRPDPACSAAVIFRTTSLCCASDGTSDIA